MDVMEWEISKAKRYDSDLALCLIGPDKTKEVNNIYGQDAEKLFLSEISKKLRECVRESDLFCPYGDEKFAIVMPNTETKSGHQACKKIKNARNQYQFKFNSSTFPLTLSIGLASLLDSKQDNPFTMMEMANKFLSEDRGRRENNIVRH